MIFLLRLAIPLKSLHFFGRTTNLYISVAFRWTLLYFHSRTRWLLILLLYALHSHGDGSAFCQCFADNKIKEHLPTMKWISLFPGDALIDCLRVCRKQLHDIPLQQNELGLWKDRSNQLSALGSGLHHFQNL